MFHDDTTMNVYYTYFNNLAFWYFNIVGKNVRKLSSFFMFQLNIRYLKKREKINVSWRYHYDCVEVVS